MKMIGEEFRAVDMASSHVDMVEERKEDRYRSTREMDDLRRELDKQRIEMDKYRQEKDKLRENAEYWRNRAVTASKNTYAVEREIKSEEKVHEELEKSEKKSAESYVKPFNRGREQRGGFQRRDFSEIKMLQLWRDRTHCEVL